MMMMMPLALGMLLLLLLLLSRQCRLKCRAAVAGVWQVAPAVMFIVACYRRVFSFVRCCAFSCDDFDGGAIPAAVPVVIFFVVAAPRDRSYLLIFAVTYLI